MTMNRKVRFAIGIPALVAIAIIAIITCDRIAIAGTTATPATAATAAYATADVYAAYALPPKAVDWMETPANVGAAAEASYDEVQARSKPDHAGNVVLALARCGGTRSGVCLNPVLLTQPAATAPKLGEHALLLRTLMGGAVAVPFELASLVRKGTTAK